jgi:hypothetical protein
MGEPGVWDWEQCDRSSEWDLTCLHAWDEDSCQKC